MHTGRQASVDPDRSRSCQPFYETLRKTKSKLINQIKPKSKLSLYCIESIKHVVMYCVSLAVRNCPELLVPVNLYGAPAHTWSTTTTSRRSSSNVCETTATRQRRHTTFLVDAKLKKNKSIKTVPHLPYPSPRRKVGWNYAKESYQSRVYVYLSPAQLVQRFEKSTFLKR